MDSDIPALADPASDDMPNVGVADADRWVELQAAVEHNRRRNRSPYSGVKIHSAAELAKIIRETDWSNSSTHNTDGHPDLRFADFRGADLRQVDLQHADLSGAILEGTNLSNACLQDATLTNTAIEYWFNRRFMFTLTGRAIYFLMAVAVAIDIFAYVVSRKIPIAGALFSSIKWGDTATVLANFGITVVTAFLVAGGWAQLYTDIVTYYVLYPELRRTGYWQYIRNSLPGTLLQYLIGGRVIVGRARTHSRGPNLAGAHLERADFRYAYLRHANLQGAFLDNADMAHSNLRGADLTSASLHGTNFSGANLTSATLSSIRRLHTAILDSDTILDNVTWDDTPRTRSDTMKSRLDRGVAARDQARVLRTVAARMRTQGLYAQASAYRAQAQRAERRALGLELKWTSWLFSLFLDIVSSYGERPARTLRAYAIVVVTGAAVFYVITNYLRYLLPPKAEQLDVIQAFILSVTCFHGRGFFYTSNSLGDPISVVAALEAVIGLFIELVFIATFNRRFMGE